jgi:thiamine-phosphate pyrophosphorylase
VILHALVHELDVARAAIDGGATVVQLRLKDLSTEEIARRGAPFAALCRERSVTFVVNDDVEAALALGANGVHLGRDDEGLERAQAAGLLIGSSARDLEEARAVDREAPAYIGAGPVWATPTKSGAAPIGADGLREICHAVASPVVAIGGIDASNARACIEAGAAGIAVVRAAADAAQIRATLERAPV